MNSEMTPAAEFPINNEPPSAVMMLSFGGIDIPWHHVAEVDSTMDYALGAVSAASNGWFLVTADYQTRGRGTHGRAWSSDPGTAILLSLVMPAPREDSPIERLSVKAAETLATVLEHFGCSPCTVKEPNDLHVRGRKIAGILLESSSLDSHLMYLILGMGVNISQTDGFFAENDLTEATSFAMELGGIGVPDHTAVLTGFLKRFVPLYTTLYLDVR